MNPQRVICDNLRNILIVWLHVFSIHVVPVVETSLSLLIAHVENEGGWEDCDLDIQYFQVEYRDHEY